MFNLFRPKWKHSNPDRRLEAAREIQDHGILKEMAANDRDWFVRHRVFDLIRDQNPADEVYAYLVKNSLDEEIRRKAIKKLKDQKVLQEVAKTDKYRYVRDAAENRLEELRLNTWGEKSDPSPETAQASNQN